MNYYTDDGYSGTTFERPDFKKMPKDIKGNKINCIIVKDLSRLGRNYIEVGKYIDEKITLILEQKKICYDVEILKAKIETSEN